MEKIGGPGENHRPVASHWETYNILYLACNLNSCMWKLHKFIRNIPDLWSTLEPSAMVIVLPTEMKEIATANRGDLRQLR